MTSFNTKMILQQACSMLTPAAQLLGKCCCAVTIVYHLLSAYIAALFLQNIWKHKPILKVFKHNWNQQKKFWDIICYKLSETTEFVYLIDILLFCLICLWSSNQDTMQ